MMWTFTISVSLKWVVRKDIRSESNKKTAQIKTGVKRATW